jgi:pimeloyl-ACP methyl ester carboxylesterase
MRAFFLAAAAAAISIPHVPLADASSCTLAYPADAVEYWTKANPVPNSDRCDWHNGTPSCHWYGWLWKSAAATASSGNLPAVVFVHGSGTSVSRGQLCEVVNKLVPLGYVVFMPYMRGVNDSSSAGTNHGFHNTGVYIADHVTQDVGPSPTNDQAAASTLSYMEAEASAEVQFALDKLTSLRSGDNSKPLVNPSRIALWGHSYGGAVSVIATGAGLTPQPAATIDLSGGVLSWAGSLLWPLIINMYAAMHQSPLYLQQVSNESPTGIKDSTTMPFDAADASGGSAEMAIFASIHPDSDTQSFCNTQSYSAAHCAHVAFMTDHDAVGHWFNTAVEFMSRHGVH